MSNVVTFIQVHGRADLFEAELSIAATIAEVHAALIAKGIVPDSETFVFIDEEEQHLHGSHDTPIAGLKHGSRIHVSRHRRIKATVNFLDKTESHEFPPGARVGSVKARAVHEFHMPAKDAAEHVLQVCKSTERPSSDTPLHQLVHEHGHEVCFDLVPEKRVEG
jgi:hypothetical protein